MEYYHAYFVYLNFNFEPTDLLDYFLIAFLIISGIGLIIAEIIFVPGTTFVGILGFAIGAFGVYRSYELYGTSVGHIVLTATLISMGIAVVLSFKSGAWKKFALKGSIDAIVNKDLTSGLTVSMKGMTVSSLKPVGKAEFDNKEFEVTSLGHFIEENQAIKIVKLERNKIFVEPIKD
ncbi:MAG: NfeD family protein [Reichenbachiella sp.]|uniref:NfeD family protein n=1 Tax=Reichenbachiella sp. TaxID=2184521 RepID=UPI003267FA95